MYRCLTGPSRSGSGRAGKGAAHYSQTPWEHKRAAPVDGAFVALQQSGASADFVTFSDAETFSRDRLFCLQSEGRWQMWYVSYRLNGSTTMRVFKTRDLALNAASAMIDEQGDREIEVGPMLAAREGNVFKGEEIRRMSDRGST